VAADGKRGRPPKLLIELIAIAVVMTAAAISIYFGFRSPPIHDELPLGGRNVDVSRSSAAQFEPLVAQDPARPSTLLAASMDDLADARVYLSTDAGRTWTSRAAPPVIRGACSLSHPSVAIGRSGLEVYASLVSDTCQPPDPLLYVAVRRGPTSRWHVRRVGATRRYSFDERPALAVDADGAIYVVWPRLLGEFTSHQILVWSRSTDGGAMWSRPRRIGDYDGVYGVDLAAAGNGRLYLAVADGRHRRIDILRSTDGGFTWSGARRAARLSVPYVVGCGTGSVVVPAQPQRCISEVPRLALDTDRLAVVFDDAAQNETQQVYVATLDRSLRNLSGPRPLATPSRAAADRFVPAVAYDRASGALWACYYDTTGDSTRKHAWYTCKVSHDDGRSWSQPVHAASASSNETETGADDLGYGDVSGLVAARGVAHPLWTDNRSSLDLAEEIYTASIPVRTMPR
jgi:hypothetical protein